MRSKILITGASGFLGSAVANNLTEKNLVLTGRVNRLNLPSFYIKELTSTENYKDCLADVDTIIHCAARAHLMNDESVNPLAEYRKVNVEGSANLAKQAIAAGVKRFIFISSVKVSGECTTGSQPYTEDLLPAPEDAYGQSKLEAEKLLKEIAHESDMELVIIRPPLVYGPGVKANFLRLVRLSNLPIPLPFGAANNRRSMVYMGNLVDFISLCLSHPAAANETFLVSDGEDLSLRTLISYIRKALGKPSWLLPFPVRLFRIAGKLIGKSSVVDRLFGDLQVNSSKAGVLLGWKPPYSAEEGINKTVLDFQSKRN
ncbi:SDR family oxidoreductase [Reinekea marina]|uniref:UDP-glucose 4-epimerase family protein n=1 Tax=Reinekea marina TaxID=1310421 RepID=A0ABV7WV97_9GAMM|nr:SDR family oxidoreductase [Reinekea marina]MDN3649321.1 SDR family oxidoreductase [Reinekea marina]